MLIYKICPKALWHEAQAAGVFVGSAHDLADGFIHFSTAEQLAGTAAKHFSGQANLLLLTIDANLLGEDLKFEPSRDGALFPHLYAPLPLHAVVHVSPYPPPLLVTLAMDEASFARFNAERQRYFPPERNFLAAHITLFHALPAGEESAIRETLAQRAAAMTTFAMQLSELWNLGRGVAYRLSSPEAQALHTQLQQHWYDWLKPQDRQRGFRPHITVQNKTTAEAARALHATLSAAFVPAEVTATGLELWRYLGGPWEHLARFDFTR